MCISITSICYNGYVKKIVYLITKSNWGGAQKAVHDLATHPKIYNNYEVVVASGNDGELLEKISSKKIRTVNLKIKNNMNPFTAFKNLFDLYFYLDKEKPDIVHLHSSKISMFGAIAARLASVPLIIFTAHGWPHNEDRNIFTKTVLRLLMWMTVSLSHRTIAVSENVVQSLRAPSFIKKKMVVVYNGIQKGDYKQLPKLSDGDKNKKIKHIVSIGELNHNKAHDTVLRILPQIKNIQYHIIGEGSSRGKLEKLIREKKLEKRVTLYGHINNAKSLLPQYDAFLLPSRTEALGYVLLEALQAGIPVIARHVGGVPEIIRDLPYARLYKYDTDLMDILNEPLPTDFKWDDKRFDFEKMIDKTLFLYK